MRHITLSILFILLSACTAQKATESTSEMNVIKACPENGTCNIERLDNSKVRLVEDSTGQFYPKMETSESHHVYKITFNKNVEKGIMDANYQEVIYFQIEVDIKHKRLIDKDLTLANVIYGRLCRCPRETGYEQISIGSLYVETKNKITEIQLQIEPENFPIVMNQLETKVSF